MKHIAISSSSFGQSVDNPVSRWDPAFHIFCGRVIAQDITVTQADWEKTMPGSHERPQHPKIAALNRASTINAIKAALMEGLELIDPRGPLSCGLYHLACRIAKTRAAMLRAQADAILQQAHQLESIQ